MGKSDMILLWDNSCFFFVFFVTVLVKQKIKQKLTQKSLLSQTDAFMTRGEQKALRQLIPSNSKMDEQIKLSSLYNQYTYVCFSPLSIHLRVLNSCNNVIDASPLQYLPSIVIHNSALP